jgi:hypothetical protein
MQVPDPMMVEEDPFTFRETEDNRPQKTVFETRQDKNLTHRTIRNSMTEQTYDKRKQSSGKLHNQPIVENNFVNTYETER